MRQSLIPHVTAWRWGHRNTPAPSRGSSLTLYDAADRVNFTAWLFIGSDWVDITNRVRGPGGISGFDIPSAGRPDGQTQVSPSECHFLINNRDGLFSNRNPNSIYYGLLPNNIPFRLSLGDAFVFHGEVAQLPLDWDSTGTDVWVSIEAADPLRRLQQGRRKLKTPVEREILSDANSPLLAAYWTLTDGGSSTMAASAIGGPAMTPSLTGVTFGSDSTSFLGSDPLPVCTGGGFTGSIPPYVFTGELIYRGLFGFGAVLIDTAVLADTFGTGAIRRWALRYRTGGGGSLSLHAYNQANVELATSGAVSFSLDGKAVLIGVDLVQNGADVNYTITVRRANRSLGVYTIVATSFTGTFVGVGTMTRPDTLVVGNGGNLSLTTVGHQLIAKDNALTINGAALNGNAGETAAARIGRLLAEEGIGFVLYGNAADTAAMGPQGTDTLANLIFAAQAADQGMVFGARTAPGIAYRTRASLYNQVGVTLDYSAAHLSGQFRPVPDDQNTRNDVIARRDGGSFSRYTVDSGPRSTLPPGSGGAGVYDEDLSYNLYADTQTADLASERAHIGTWDEDRYPTAAVNLARAPYRADVSLTAGVLALMPGSLLTVVNPLSGIVAPEPVELIIQGYSMQITAFEVKISYNCTPYGPYRMWQIEHNLLGHLAPDGQTMSARATAAATSLSVTTVSGKALASTSAADYPVDIMIVGERMTLTAVSGAASPQTFTVTRAVNGISKALPIDSPITLAPAYRVGIAR